jgi:uncharacterized heparinase superfamily protein
VSAGAGLTSDPGRWARTALATPPRQLAHRLRRRALSGRALSDRALADREGSPPEWPGWPPGWVPADGRLPGLWPPAGDILAGRMTLLGHTRPLGDPPDWDQRGAPLLWRFHLHYWDWAWALAGWPDAEAARARFGTLYRSWHANHHRDGVVWAPYVASLRAWTWCGVGRTLAGDGPLGAALRADLRRHARFLTRSLERDLGGNHLLKNLKALLGLAAAAGDAAGVARWSLELARQARAQVLPDGGHIERSPSYHVQVLADLIDVAGLLAALGAPVPTAITEAVERMRGWLAAVATPAGLLPPLNDGYPVPPPVVAALRGDRARPDRALLAASGLAVLRAGGFDVTADVGGPGPGPSAGHSHAGTLGFELRLDDRRFVVDPGTSTYDPGPRRAFERSTRAHPTVCLDGVDSSEAWGAFRMGRRARVRTATLETGPTLATGPAGAAVLSARHDGYRALCGGTHERRWEVRPAGVTVTDLVTGSGQHQVEVVFPLEPGVRAAVTGGGVLAARGDGRPLLIHAGDSAGRGRWRVERALAAAGWNRLAPHDVAVYRLVARLPVTVTTRLTAAEPAGTPHDHDDDHDGERTGGQG